MPIITQALDRVRLELGDTDPSRALFTDDEILTYLDDNAQNWLLAAADLCDVLATRFARDYDFGWSDQQKFNRSQMSKQYAARGADLRGRAAKETSGTPLYNFPASYPVLDI